MVPKNGGSGHRVVKAVLGAIWKVIEYKSLVRPPLEHCAILASSYRKEVIKLKMVQKRFSRLLIELVGLSYRE